MQNITIKLAEAADFPAAAPLLFPSAQAPLKENGCILLAYPAEDGAKPCGALGALPQKAALRVISLFVEEDMRHTGIAAALIAEAETLAQSHEIPQIEFSYACTDEQALQMDAFFMKKGYPMPLAGETMFTIPLEELQNSAFFRLMQHAKPSRDILPLHAIPKRSLEKLPPYLSPDAAAGRLIPELCLGYVCQGQLTAMLVVTDTDGTLHLHSAYLAEKNHALHLMSLLRQAYETIQEKYSQYQQLTITEGSENGYHLILELLAGAKKSRSTLYTAVKAVSPTPPYLMPIEFAAAISRLQSYMDVFAEQGIATELTLPNGGMPYLELACGTDSLVLSYDIEETDELQFTLLAEYILPPSAAEQQARIEERLRADDVPYRILRTTAGEFFLRGSLSEGGDSAGFAPAQQIAAFILPFRAYIEKMLQEMQL